MFEPIYNDGGDVIYLEDQLKSDDGNIYDTETKEGTLIENEAMNAPGGAGIKAAQTVIDAKAEIVLVPRCGENAAKALEAGGVKLYESVGLSVEENIQAFLDGKLAVLTDIHPGFHGHGGN